MLPGSATAASLLPSAEIATEVQCNDDTVFEPQSAPPFVEVKIGPAEAGPPAATTSLLPSAEEAAAYHKLVGAVVCVQVWASV